MNEDEMAPKEMTDEEMEQGVLKQYVLRNKLDENLSPGERDSALGVAKRLMVSRRKYYERKNQRQFELQRIRDDVWFLRNHHDGNHKGFLDMLDSLESSIELDFDSMKKGYIER